MAKYRIWKDLRDPVHPWCVRGPGGCMSLCCKTWEQARDAVNRDFADFVVEKIWAKLF